MANFFKDYHKQIKAKRQAEEVAKRDDYLVGQVVYINPNYDEHKNGKKYFIEYLEDTIILLADTKKEALCGYGHIYSVYDLKG